MISWWEYCNLQVYTMISIVILRSHCFYYLQSPCVKYDLCSCTNSVGTLQTVAICITWSLCVYHDSYVYTTISMCIRPSLCVCYNLCVYTSISMCILQTLCIYYNLYVYTTNSMRILQSLCVYYNLYVYTMIFMCRYIYCNLYVYTMIFMCILQSLCVHFLQSQWSTSEDIEVLLYFM